MIEILIDFFSRSKSRSSCRRGASFASPAAPGANAPGPAAARVAAQDRPILPCKRPRSLTTHCVQAPRGRFCESPLKPPSAQDRVPAPESTDNQEGTVLAVVHSYWVHGGSRERPCGSKSRCRNGLPLFTVVGPGRPARSARARSASWRRWPRPDNALPALRVTVNLAPADLPKSGSGFDLPDGRRASWPPSGVSPPRRFAGLRAFVGELGLDGSVRPVRGAIALAMRCRKPTAGRRLYVPGGQRRAEAAAVPGIEVVGVWDSLAGAHRRADRERAEGGPRSSIAPPPPLL